MSTNLHQLKEIFTRVKHHLLTQGVQSKAQLDGAVAPVCTYRGDDGTKCAVGCLISDERYHIGLERVGASEVNVKIAIERSLDITLSEIEIALLIRLQKVHDHTPPESWEIRLDFEWHEFLDSRFPMASRVWS